MLIWGQANQKSSRSPLGYNVAKGGGILGKQSGPLAGGNTIKAQDDEITIVKDSQARRW